MTRRTSGSMAAVIGTAALVSFSMTGAPAAADPAADKPVRTAAVAGTGAVPGGFASWEQLLRTQERLVRAAARITAASGTNSNGFAGIVVAPEQRRLQVFWKGRTPARVSALISTVRRDVAVSVRPAAHSQRELAQQARRLATRSPGHARITSVAPKVDGSGLAVTVAAGAATAARSLAEETSVPLEITSGTAPALATRWNDSPPWYGGAAWRNATRGGGCSTGFAVWHAGRTKMLSAGHCAAVGDRATDPTGETMGTVSQDSNAYDVQLIDARSAGRVFNNTASLSEFTNPVIGTAGSYVGMYICTSGAYSGTRCRIQVKRTGVTINIGYLIFNTVQAERVDRTNAVGQGDSGGAVQVVASDTTKVYAAGVNTAIDLNTAAACTGYVTSGRSCAWRMYYAPWSSASAQFGTAIVTG